MDGNLEDQTLPISKGYGSGLTTTTTESSNHYHYNREEWKSISASPLPSETTQYSHPRSNVG